MQRTGRREKVIRALLIPAATELACRVIAVGYSAAALSDAIGGGLLDDLYYGNLDDQPDHDVQPGSSGCTGRFCFYADLDRVAKRLPVNQRAEVLAARLNCIGELRSVPLTGDVLVTGATLTRDDTHVSDQVVSAARLAGLLPRAADREPDPKPNNRVRRSEPIRPTEEMNRP